ncbi:Uncharacterized protein {ECO:0000313/EMBL:CCF10249.1} [Pantoea ananatis]|nr:Uncharacterized protein {ECO:0000313/EMBL:CCF10249.1} [Pantoea ananatis]
MLSASRQQAFPPDFVQLNLLITCRNGQVKKTDSNVRKMIN